MFHFIDSEEYSDSCNNKWKNVHNRVISQFFEGNTWEKHRTKKDNRENKSHSTGSILFFIFISERFEKKWVREIHRCTKTDTQNGRNDRKVTEWRTKYGNCCGGKGKQDTKNHKKYPTLRSHFYREKASENGPNSRIEEDHRCSRAFNPKGRTTIFYWRLRYNRRNRPKKWGSDNNREIVLGYVLEIRDICLHWGSETLSASEEVISPSFW